ncbi:MAG: hypothetical protein ACR2QQ_00005 [Gammaproteobacteria bacterium]
MTFVAGLVILGFPLALILSWAYELTPEGMKKSQEVPATESVTHSTGRKLDFAIIAALVLALGFVVYEYVLVDRDSSEMAGDVLPNSVAVLPFENLSPDPDNAYFAAGIHESTLNQLAKIRDLSLIARTSVMQYEDDPPPIPEIAEALKVEMVMEGSVRYANDRVLITAQLIDGRSGTHLWSEEYDRDLADVFAVQAEIAERIARALEAELTPSELERIERPPTTNAAAYEAYLRSLTRGLPSAVVHDYLDQAILLDPTFALAYARQGFLYAFDITETVSVQNEDLAELETLARRHAEKALELDSDLGYAYVALGRLHWSYWREDEAQAAFEQALQLSQNDSAILRAYAQFDYRRGEHLQAIQMAERAVELDPNNAGARSTLGDAFFFAKRSDAAASAYLKGIELAPASRHAHLQLGLAEAMRGNDTQALEELRITEQLGLPRPADLVRTAYGYAQIGRPGDAARLLGEFEEFAASDIRIGPAQWGLAHLAAGDSAQALEWFNTAADNRIPVGGFFITAQVKGNVLSDPILDQPEFVEVRSRLGFRE